MRLSQIVKSMQKIATSFVILQFLLFPKNVLSIDQWQAGGAGIEWQSIGQLTGITTNGTSIIPAVVDSTTNAVGLLALKNRGGNISSPQASNVDLTGLLTDGNRETFWRVERERRPDGTSMIIDLGAILPINRIRIQGDDETYLRAYELFVHDGDPETLREEQPVAFINQVSSNLEQDTPIIDVQITLQFVRFIRLISRSSQEFAIEDVEVFGDGYAPTGSFTSDIINLGAAANFGNISLKTQIDSLTNIVLQTRTGIVPDPKIYFRKTEIFQGEERAEEAILPIGQAEAEDTYFSLRVADRGSIEDNIVEWSPWSAPYENLFDDFQSPGNRQYVQFRLIFSSEDARQAALVENLIFTYSTPTLANNLIAEISPGEVTLGETHSFDYYILSEFGNEHNGFDRIEISTPFMANVNDVELDNEPVAYEIAQATDGLLSIRLTEKRIDQTGQLLRINFSSLVTVYGTTFFAKAFDGEKQGLGQNILAGEVTPLSDSNRLSVQGLLRDELILDFTTVPQVFSPNNDEVNDFTDISFILLRALQPVDISLTVQELSGRVIKSLLQQTNVINGPAKTFWDGTDDYGRTVMPGTYIIHIAIDTDTGKEEKSLLVGVVY